MAKAQDLVQEQEAAQNYLKKAFPTMLALLEYRLANGEPLMVMRPLRYQTSEIPQAEEDDGFYQTRKSEGSTKFVDVIKTIMPGTQLVLKALDPVLQEFVFVDAQNKEYALNFVERNNLMTQTDIYETVKSYLEAKGEESHE
jgi:hypothetical protein